MAVRFVKHFLALPLRQTSPHQHILTPKGCRSWDLSLPSALSWGRYQHPSVRQGGLEGTAASPEAATLGTPTAQHSANSAVSTVHQ